MAGAVPPLGDEACAPKDPQVMGDDLLRYTELGRDLAHGSGLIANPGEDPSTCAVRQRMQRPVDRFSLACHRSIQALICTNVNLTFTTALKR